jgi:hypothetical protein
MNEHIEPGNTNNNKIIVLLREYTDQRAEIRLFEALGIICIVLSALTLSAMLVAGVSSKGYVILLISPALSLFFIIMAMALGVHAIALLLRLGDVEDNINKIVGESLLKFMDTIIYVLKPDVIEKGIGKHWKKIS